MSQTLINCTCKNRLGFSLPPLTLIPQYFKRFNRSKTRWNKRNLKTKQWNPLRLRLFSLASMTSWSFQTVRRMHEGWKQGDMCSVSVFFVRVGSQISPLRAKKNWNIPSPGRTRSVKCHTPGPTKTIKSPPHALPPPCRLYIYRCIMLSLLRLERKQKDFSKPFRIRIFFFLSYSFGIETIKTLIQSLICFLKNHTRFQFRPKRHKNPTWWGGTYLYSSPPAPQPGCRTSPWSNSSLKHFV